MNPIVIIGSFAAFAVSLSFYAEFALNHPPCSLCWIQRALWMSLLPTVFCGFFLKTVARKTIILLLALNVCVASYHTLVQLKIIEDRCETHLDVKDINAYASFLKKESHGCADNSWKIGKIPTPLLNGATCLALLYFIWRRRE